MARFLKPLFIFATVLMLTGVLYSIGAETSDTLSFGEKLLAAALSFVLIAGINYAVYRLIRYLWRG
ncbi:hypothetical protein ACFFJY_04065 [Fictibacillus aquaticus]|uniref:Uncharacterized protein n=1 Tax=Fictibacillus aquaticus TaxID=2021314 RepID=A0A235F764_9BACL|nr:hypothetical protein [Fictibacillus aquaticus]OYD56954.1 hypothetical protein CGZ90_14690 [Fictibacillus aquaticus]